MNAILTQLTYRNLGFMLSPNPVSLCRVIYSLFPQVQTLWINIESSWSIEWATLHPSWMSSSKEKSSHKRRMITSGLCVLLRRRWGRSTLVASKLVDVAKTSSGKSFRKMSNFSLLTSKESSKCRGEIYS